VTYRVEFGTTAGGRPANHRVPPAVGNTWCVATPTSINRPVERRSPPTSGKDDPPFRQRLGFATYGTMSGNPKAVAAWGNRRSTAAANGEKFQNRPYWGGMGVRPPGLVEGSTRCRCAGPYNGAVGGHADRPAPAQAKPPDP